MKLTMHKASTITAEGKSTNGNRKPIYNITTGEVYASSIDAAKKLGVHPSTISWVITGRMEKVKGMRLCPLANITENFEEIATDMRAVFAKARLYDEAIAHQKAFKEANETLILHQTRCEELEIKLAEEKKLAEAAAQRVVVLKEATPSLYMM